jgi:hypothetical protein
MSFLLVSLVTVIYAAVSLTYLWDGRHGLSLTFFAYALANVGLLWSAK